MKVGECRDCSYWEMDECHKNAPGLKADPQLTRAGTTPVFFVPHFPPTQDWNWCGEFHFKDAREGP